MFVYRTGKVHDDFTHDTFVVTVGNETESWTFKDQEKNQVILTIEVEG